MTTVPESPDGGLEHLIWVGRFHLALVPLGALVWFPQGRIRGLVFLVGSACSLAFWFLHRILVGRMLNEKVRLRWLYGFLAMLKLTLIVLVVRGMMDRYPAEALPLATGVLLFVAAILLEALRLLGSSFFHPSDDEPR